MSWGTWIGAGVGWFLGGPIGAIIGGIIGHSVSAQERDVIYENYNNRQGTYRATQQDIQMGFIVTLVTILTKLAQADGQVSPEEVREIRNFFSKNMNYRREDMNFIKELIKQAMRTNVRLEELIAQFSQLTPPDVHLELLNMLYRIAMADGIFHPKEDEYINRVVVLLGINETAHNQIRSIYISDIDRYYKILGVTRNADNSEIEKSYRKLIKEYHPDKIQSKGLPEEFVKFANERMQKINEAYQKIKEERNL